jgi:hypothetical protein
VDTQMDVQAELAIAKQSFEAMISLCEPRLVVAWTPSNEQRTAYVRFAEQSLDGLSRLEQIERRRLLNEGIVQSFVPEGILTFIREQMKPRVREIIAALDSLDPEGKLFRELMYDFEPATGPSFAVRCTFEEGVQQIYQLLERNPDWEDDHSFVPDTAVEVLDSKLINFEPDEWLKRAGEILPIRTSKRDVALPMHLRMRLEELYRAYVFGCWLSVLGLCRSILEYAILDNLHKWKIEQLWPPERDGKRKEKKLGYLIEEVSLCLPQIKEPMERLRNYGNEYLHPKKSRVSKESLLDRQPAAKQAMAALIPVVESLYLAAKNNEALPP